MAKVRTVTPADLPGVRKLLEELGYASSLDEVARRVATLTGGSGGLLVVDGPAYIVGFASYDLWFAFAEGAWVCRLSALCVAGPVRRGGVGEALVAEVERIAASHDCTLIELSSGRRPGRASAHAFYPALGFEDRSPHHAFYAKPLT
jgi:GNAT superfamily N-acetyltransferase